MHEVLLLLLLVVMIWMAAWIALLGLLAGSRERQPSVMGLHPYPQSKLSVSPAMSAKGFQPAYRLEQLPLLLIAHGKVIEENLRQTGRTRFWLNHEVTLKGMKGIRQVYWCTINCRGELYIASDKNTS